MCDKLFSGAKPPLTTMIRDDNPQECIATVKNAIYDGTDYFGLHLSCLKPKYCNERNLKEIFASMGRRPVYLTSYRGIYNEGLNDDKCMEKLITALKAGGTICDIMADTYDKSEGEMTYDPSAIKKQRALIDKVHDMGKTALMSTHALKFLKSEEVLEIALEHQARGADISKIVTAGYNEKEEMSNIQTFLLLKEKLKIPFLFLSCGTHYKIHRLFGPMLGNCMQLCVQRHDETSAKCKPVLHAARQFYDSADWFPDI